MQNVGVLDWEAPALLPSFTLLFVSISGLLLCVVCLLSIIYCRKSAAAPKNSAQRLASPSSSHINIVFNISETCPSRIEERRCKRMARLKCEGDPTADVTLEGIDRSISKALAVERLMQDSYVFDTHVMKPPSGGVRVVAAKRDYI